MPDIGRAPDGCLGAGDGDRSNNGAGGAADSKEADGIDEAGSGTICGADSDNGTYNGADISVAD